jgi:hypothetical protein
LEAEHIRECEAEVKRANSQRLHAGLLTYESGFILLVHITYEKTRLKWHKRRRNFDELATFVRYDDGHAVVDLLNPYPDLKRLGLPLYYTKLVAYSLDDMKAKNIDKQFMTIQSTV